MCRQLVLQPITNPNLMVKWSFNMFESKGQFVPLKDSKSNLRHQQNL